MERYCKNGKPYIYTVFSASKQEQILPVLEKVAENGAAFWYAYTFDRKEQRRLQGAFGVLLFVDKELADSERFREVVNAAVSYGQKILCVYLEDIPTSSWSRMQLGHQQSISADKMDDALVAKLEDAFIFRDMKVTETQKKFQRNRAITLTAIPVLAAVILFFAVINPLLIAPIRAVNAQAEQWGLTREDLESITELYIIGDQAFQTKVHGWYANNNRSEVAYNMQVNISDLVVMDAIPVGTLTSDDLEIFAYMPNLQRLAICGNQLTDISALTELVKLEYLDLSANPISNLDGIEKLENLGDLLLSYTDVGDDTVSNIWKCSQIHTLNLDGTRVTNVSGVEQLKNLGALVLSSTSVRDISMVSELKKLTYLAIQNTYVNTLPEFHLKTGIHLDIRECSINNLSSLGQMNSFDQLDISTIRPQTVLQYIAGIPCQTFCCSSISSLDELEGLKVNKGGHLGIANSYLTTLDGIDEFEGIAELDVHHSRDAQNFITDLTATLQLKSLKTLTVASDMKPLVEEQLQDATFDIMYDDN